MVAQTKDSFNTSHTGRRQDGWSAKMSSYTAEKEAKCTVARANRTNLSHIKLQSLGAYFVLKLNRRAKFKQGKS